MTDEIDISRYAHTITDIRTHPGSRVVRMVVDVDAPDLLLGVRRLIAGKAATATTAGTVANILDLDEGRFDVRIWMEEKE